MISEGGGVSASCCLLSPGRGDGQQVVREGGGDAGQRFEKLW